MLLIQLQERTDKMRLIYAEYNPQTNSIDVSTFENYILRIDCNKAEDGLITTPCSQNSLNALAIDEPLEYVRIVSNQKQVKLSVIRSVDVPIFLRYTPSKKECVLMGREICNIINDMAEVLNASQMQKLQEVLVKRLSENNTSDYLQTGNEEFLDMFLTAKHLEGCSICVVK